MDSKSHGRIFFIAELLEMRLRSGVNLGADSDTLGEPGSTPAPCLWVSSQLPPVQQASRSQRQSSGPCSFIIQFPLFFNETQPPLGAPAPYEGRCAETERVSHWPREPSKRVPQHAEMSPQTPLLGVRTPWDGDDLLCGSTGGSSLGVLLARLVAVGTDWKLPRGAPKSSDPRAEVVE